MLGWPIQWLSTHFSILYTSIACHTHGATTNRKKVCDFIFCPLQHSQNQRNGNQLQWKSDMVRCRCISMTIKSIGRLCANSGVEIDKTTCSNPRIMQMELSEICQENYYDFDWHIYRQKLSRHQFRPHSETQSTLEDARLSLNVDVAANWCVPE